jgi:hypothetical protein
MKPTPIVGAPPAAAPIVIIEPLQRNLGGEIERCQERNGRHDAFHFIFNDTGLFGKTACGGRCRRWKTRICLI